MQEILTRERTGIFADHLRKAILQAQNHRGKTPEPGGESMWSADFNDAPNLVDEVLAEVHQ